MSTVLATPPRPSAPGAAAGRDRRATGKRITIRVSVELYDAIQKLAKRDRRTIAGWVKIAAEDAVATASGTKKR